MGGEDGAALQRVRIRRIAGWIGTMDWIATAPVFLIFGFAVRSRTRGFDLA